MQVQMLMVPGVSPVQAAVAALSSVAPAASRPAKISGSSLHTLPGPSSVLKPIIRTPGFRGMWLGQTATLIRQAGGDAAWFAFKGGRRDVPAQAARRPVLPQKGTAYMGVRCVWCRGEYCLQRRFLADTMKRAIQTEAEVAVEGS
ncbi:hypothetical protein EVJ58_g1606 [Rhodofomes roseus]|uniref:Uncharacterized protein n=1 Tax=Rhodofomes roseus TaxID=34475 RepID=A0A4Y9Z0C1_9APHY|nr:hypothetical protein EVJ58_g1606 [Rhodofomes roseus]